MQVHELIQFDGDDHKPLTAKQDWFCEEYMLDFNATQSAIRAGFSRRSARKIASNLMRQPHIQKRIAELKKELAAKHEITLDQIVSELKKLAFFNAGSFINLTEDGMPYIDIEKMSRDDMAAIESLEFDFKNGKIKIKTHGKREALRMLRDIVSDSLDANENEDWDVKHVFEFEHNHRDNPA